MLVLLALLVPNSTVSGASRMSPEPFQALKFFTRSRAGFVRAFLDLDEERVRNQLRPWAAVTSRQGDARRTCASPASIAAFTMRSLSREGPPDAAGQKIPRHAEATVADAVLAGRVASVQVLDAQVAVIDHVPAAARE